MTYYFWGYEDGIIADDNGVLACETCPCETGTATSSGTVAEDCEYCDTGETPYQILVEVPSIGSGTCLDCGSLAGSYVVTQYGALGSCWWRGVFPNPTTCQGFGNVYDQLLINLWLTTIDSAVNADLIFASSIGGGSVTAGSWKYTPLGTATRPSCLFNSFVVPPSSNGWCSPMTGPDNLVITAL